MDRADPLSIVAPCWLTYLTTHDVEAAKRTHETVCAERSAPDALCRRGFAALLYGNPPDYVKLAAAAAVKYRPPPPEE